MSKQKNIKIPLPNWKWWQTALIFSLIIFVFKIEPNNVYSLIKFFIVKWLSK